MCAAAAAVANVACACDAATATATVATADAAAFAAEATAASTTSAAIDCQRRCAATAAGASYLNRPLHSFKKGGLCWFRDTTKKSWFI